MRRGKACHEMARCSPNQGAPAPAVGRVNGGIEMKLSACVIVKNEAKNLPRWFSYAKAAADEMIVVDTGSADETVMVAKAAGAKVYSFFWQNDFAAAKNFAIEQATGDWIAFLDADEYFLPANGAAVRALLEGAAEETEAFLFRLVDLDADKEGAYIGSAIQWRIFRRRPGLRYVGAVHEELADAAGREVRTVFVPDVPIYHTGYSSSVIRQKIERNLAILLAERKRRGAKARDAFYLADCYYGLGDYESAARFAREAVESRFQAQGMNNRPYAVLLQSLVQLERPIDEIEAAYRLAAHRYPRLAEFPLMWGGCLWQRKDYVAAENMLRRGVALYDKGVGEACTDVSAGEQARNFLPAAFWKLGKLALWRGQAGEALAHFSRGLRQAPYEEVLLRSAAGLLREAPAADVIAFFNTLYDKQRDAAYLAQTLARTPLREAALYYDRQSGGRGLSEAETFRLAKRPAACAAAALGAAESMSRLGVWAQEGRPSPEGTGGLHMLLSTALRRAAVGDAATAREKREMKAICRLRRALGTGEGRR